LFKENRLLDYFMQADEDSIIRLFTLVDDVKNMDPSQKIQLKQKIKEKYPNFHFIGEPEIEKVRRGLIVTRKGYEEKQKSLRNLIEVEIPENSKEIGIALKKGDLRENAEYKAALEKQEFLKNSISKRQEELQNAQIFDEREIDLNQVYFGTVVELENLISNETEEYTIYGPWESNPAKNIISYLSPLGIAIYNQKPGNELNFKINKKNYNYRIVKIRKAE